MKLDYSDIKFKDNGKLKLLILGADMALLPSSGVSTSIEAQS